MLTIRHHNWGDNFTICTRYGDKLSGQERGLFEGLREHDYEVDFYLRVLEAAEESQRAPAGSGLSAQTRNRRWAALQRLEQGGEYFSEARLAPCSCTACALAHDLLVLGSCKGTLRIRFVNTLLKSVYRPDFNAARPPLAGHLHGEQLLHSR